METRRCEKTCRGGTALSRRGNTVNWAPSKHEALLTSLHMIKITRISIYLKAKEPMKEKLLTVKLGCGEDSQEGNRKLLHSKSYRHKATCLRSRALPGRALRTPPVPCSTLSPAPLEQEAGWELCSGQQPAPRPECSSPSSGQLEQPGTWDSHLRSSA